MQPAPPPPLPPPASSEAEEEFDTKNMSAKQKAEFKSFGAARKAGAPMTDPPRVDAKRMVREDTPWYISAAFVKIFQTGAGDYWAYAAARKKRGMDVSLQTWVQHVMEGRDGRALRHPRFFYFAVNTLLRNKAVRGKSYFVKKSMGDQAYREYTPKELLKMGKSHMSKVLCAYETNLPGSAAEKLAQRADLEAMLNQLEMESVEKAADAMPARHEALTESLQKMQAWRSEWQQQEGTQADVEVEGAFLSRQDALR